MAVDGSPNAWLTRQKSAQLVSPTQAKSTPVPVILGVSFSDHSSTEAALAMMDEWVLRFQQTGRNISFLWVGSTQNRHINEHARQIAKQYALKTAEAARQRNMDVLDMYNTTSLAASWDARHYGVRISLLQAMMVRCSSVDYLICVEFPLLRVS